MANENGRGKGRREGGEEERNNKLIVAKREMDFGTSEGSFAALSVSQSVSHSLAQSLVRPALRARLPEGREDHGAVVQEDPEAVEAACDDGVLLEPLDDGRGVAAGGALQSEAGAVGEDGRVGRLREPERRQEGHRRRRKAFICNENDG